MIISYSVQEDQLLEYELGGSQCANDLQEGPGMVSSPTERDSVQIAFDQAGKNTVNLIRVE